MTVLLFQICLLSACSNTLFNAKRLNRITKAHVVARRTTAPLRSRQRRTHGAPAAAPYRKRRRASAFARRAELFQQTSQNHTPAAPTSDESPCFNSLDRAAVEHLFTLYQGKMEGDGSKPDPAPRPSSDKLSKEAGASEIARSEAMPPPPLPMGGGLDEHASETRSARSESTASRNTNRLSLTLPIAPPTACPSRPPPSSSTAVSSYPPTPIDTSAVTSPTDTNNFITAIATQERRVLELREELDGAERELSRLKKQWAHHEAFKKRSEIRRKEPLRPLSLQIQTSTPPNPEEDPLTRRSVEMDRRKALLLGQQSAQSTPTQSRRRVFRGAHTRTLSLLSPTKTTDDFSVHEDDVGLVKSPSQELEAVFQSIHRRSPITPAQLSKRASWAPRSTQQVGGLKQVADDFKAGLWTFVEDLRQATVGDEPITGNGAPSRGAAGNLRAGHSLSGENQDTIKASGPTTRPHVSRAFEHTPTPPARYTDNPERATQNTAPAAEHQRKVSKAEGKAAKRFSWTPLTVDSFDDNDWTNWDSPPVKSPRWSGTTVNGDLIDAIPEKNDENETPSATQRTGAQSSTPSDSPSKLDDMSWAVLNRLTPGNIKRTASDFMKEWEKSLSPTRDGLTVPEENRDQQVRTVDLL